MHKLVLTLLLLSSVSYANNLLSRQKVMMGTFITLSAPKNHASVLQEGFKELQAIDKALSTFNSTSDIYQLNHNKESKLTSYSYEALQLSLKYYKKSNGYFDITIGSLTKDVYQFGLGREPTITTAQLDAKTINIQGLHVKKMYAQIDSNIKLDLGGMGKGYGVDKVYEIYKENSVTKGIIKLSGDIKCVSTCKVFISDPFKEESNFAYFTTKKPALAISTSGNYRRYVKTKSNNHLINPKRKRSQHNFASLTLISVGLNSELDAMATAIMVMPKEEAMAFLKENDYTYILVDNEKNIYLSERLNHLIEFKLLYALK